MVIVAESLKGKEVVTQDAYVMGSIIDIRYDPISWNIEGFKVKTSKEVSAVIDAGTSKSLVLIKPPAYALNDVLLIPDELVSKPSYIKPDSDSMSELSVLNGVKVITSAGETVGYVTDILLDLDNWFVHSFKIKLDKMAYEMLGIKKGLILAKTISGVLATHIKAVNTANKGNANIMLSLTAEELKSVITLD